MVVETPLSKKLNSKKIIFQIQSKQESFNKQQKRPQPIMPKFFGKENNLVTNFGLGLYR